ncbi:MAG: hypothetical protein AAGJ18_26770 [Bacteroidota bacterium]
MNTKHLLRFVLLLLPLTAFTQRVEELQNKQRIFQDSTIVWAAYFEIDVIPDLPLETIRKKHARLPNLARGYGQLSDTLRFLSSVLDSTKHQMLNGFILGQTESIEWYEADATTYGGRSHKLKQPLHHWNLALENINIEPETFGEYPRLPDDYFEAFRLKGILHYQKNTHQFYAIPEAIAMLKNMDGDTKAVWDFEVVAWMPVSDQLKKSGWETGLTGWAQYIERSIPLSDLFVFKQEWTSDEVFSDQTNFLRQNAQQVKIQHPYPVDQDFYFDQVANGSIEENEISAENFIYMTANEIKEIATYSELESYETEHGYEDYHTISYPIDWSVFKAIRFGMNWAWLNGTQELSVEMTTYLPFDDTPDDGVDFFIPRYYYRLPFGKVEHEKN